MTIVHAVVSGIVRSELETRLVFRELLEARDNGIIGRIVFVTWDDHLEKQAPLKEFLIDHGIDVLGIPFPEKAPTVPNVQMVQLYSALSLFDDDDTVLRTRIDKVFPALRSFLSNAQSLMERTRRPDDEMLLERKVIVEALGVNDLFGHADFLLVGRVGDVRRLINLDNYFLVFNKVPATPEAQWQALPFIRQYPGIRAIFEGLNHINLCEALTKWSHNPSLVLPDMLVRILAHYFDLCRRHYVLVNDIPLAHDLTLRQAIGGGDPSGWNWGLKTFVLSNEWLTRFSTGENCAPFDAYLPLYATGQLPPPKPTLDDMDDIRRFIADAIEKDIKDIWRGSAFGVPTLIKGKTAPKTAPTYQDVVYGSLNAVGVDLPSTITEEIADSISQTFENYSPQKHGRFAALLENCAKKICIYLEEKYPVVPPQMLALPALLFSAALTFGWETHSMEWLCQALIEEKIPLSFAPLVHWGVMARVYEKPPYIMFLAGILLLKGIGKAPDPERALQLIAEAAQNGDPQAQAFLTATRKT